MTRSPSVRSDPAVALRQDAHRAHLGLGMIAALTLVLSGCVPSESAPSDPSLPAAGGSVSPAPREVLATGLQTPWSVVFVGTAMLVSERDTGRIVQLTADGGRRTVATLGQAVHRGEGGLLGLAVHDDWLYASLTTATDNRIVRLPASEQDGRVTLGEPRAVITGLPSASFHNGGRIAFGPDGKLYTTVGDAGQRSAAQDRGALGGKILRLQPDGTVPDDNPFDGSPVYSYGHRNPQGLAWDASGTMFASEFGQDTWDELNIIRPGRNYGWPTVEGIADDPRFVDPVQQWAPGDASPSGIAIADGGLFIANLRGESLRRVPLDDVGTSEVLLRGTYGRIRDVTVGRDGALLIATSNTDGRGTPAADDDRIIRLALE